MAIGLSLIIIAGHMDLSVESVVALAGDGRSASCSAPAASGSASALDPEWLVLPVSLAIALVVGAVIGAINGFLVVTLEDERLHRHARLLHLGARPGRGDLRRALGAGPARTRCASSASSACSASRSSPGSRSPVFVVFAFILRKTPFGRHLTMIGGNPIGDLPRRHQGRPRSSRSPSSWPARIAGLAGWLLAIRTSGATANLGIGMLFQAFAAVVIGGVSLKGGDRPPVGRLCRRAAALVDPDRDQPDGPARPLHPDDPRRLVLAAVLLDTVKTHSQAALSLEDLA